MRIGHGFDVHAFTKDRPCIIGGVTIPYERGLWGHSDADVCVHALMDALLSAARLGDIGQLFPPDDPKYDNADSCKLLHEVVRRLQQSGFAIVDCDCTIAAQVPKISPYRELMRKKLAEVMDIPLEHIGIKATTTEGLGFVGRSEGIAAWACVLLEENVCAKIKQ